MRAFVVLLVSVSLVYGEAPFNQNQGKFRSRFLARQEAEATTPETAPYPPSGWRPSGQPFTLPPRQTFAPSQQYGTPSQSYGPPSQTYGAPTTSLPIIKEQKEPETENVDASASDRNGKLEKTPKKEEKPDQSVQSPVLLFLPESPLQKLQVLPQVLPQTYQYFGVQNPLTSSAFVYTPQYAQYVQIG